MLSLSNSSKIVPAQKYYAATKHSLNDYAPLVADPNCTDSTTKPLNFFVITYATRNKSITN